MNRKIDKAFEELEAKNPSLDEIDADIDEDAVDEQIEEANSEYLRAADADELTDEDVAQEVRRMDEAKRVAVQNSRRPGQVRKDSHARPSKAQAEHQARHQEHLNIDWSDPSSTLAPPPQAGMEQRWIRVQLGSANDPKNWQRKVRERWVPRRLETVPEQYAPPTFKHGTLGDVIGVLDVILCERPIEVGIARRKHYREKTMRQRAAATHQSLAQNAGADNDIVVQEKRAMTRGRGKRRPVVQD